MHPQPDPEATYEPPAPSARPGARRSSAFVAPALTILAHPDPSRVGASAHLPSLDAGAGVELSRVAPAFRGRSGPARPLEDRALSRKATRIARRRDGAVELHPDPAGASLVVDGLPIDAAVVIAPDALARGVVLELAGRVSLLLYLASPPPVEPAPDCRMIGISPGLERAREQIRAVAGVDVPVLLRGETGTGKELAARALHDASPRRGGPFVAVNMGAIPPTLAPSELFGHVRGAFSGAVTSRDGRFVSADGGTLFLDEIGEAPVEVQVMLLRALETRTIQAVGGSTSRRVDVRLIAATDAALEDAVAGGRFRGPLYHRLAGYEILLPSLRERREDIGALLTHVLSTELAAFGAADRLVASDPGRPPWLPLALLRRLVRFDWPGNIRQLRNVARQLAVSNHARAEVALDPSLERLLDDVGLAPPAPPAPSAAPAPLTDERVLSVLAANGHRLGRTAAALGVARNTLNNFIARSDRIRRPRELTAAEISEALAASAGDHGAAAQRLGVSERGLKLRQRDLGMRADGG